MKRGDIVFIKDLKETDSILSNLNEEQKNYLFELRDVFGCNLQYYIE